MFSALAHERNLSSRFQSRQSAVILELQLTARLDDFGTVVIEEAAGAEIINHGFIGDPGA